ncbi:serine/threonine-protein kinase [Blastococcus sp. LR1]|uniref:serine/threonine-protein kinase n=1 Tax=Blastococcus sp. LR1 TaxID=2877000 RepID=UPI001CCE90EE|nr:serine/threonine-protein kinase [Blastococcus sp. LR1]MCA0145214.1 protein kinase [Blastococcus sp. LR1]
MTIVGNGRELLDNRYELHHLIATGGMGEVWRGRDVRLDRPVAIKLLRSEYADDAGFVARFRAEATHAAGLSHPNIAAVHDYGETRAEATGERIAYLVMELVDGEPLSARFGEDGALDTATALSVLRQAAAALAEAHSAGVVHRDVKPANILIDRDGQVKLTDFGIAWSAASVPLTAAGQVIGTPQYMSPEQAVGETPRPASDVYALGLVGYESLSGHAAFEGDNPVTLALKQVRQEPEPLPDAVPEEVRSLIDGALTKDPDARFPDAHAFLAAIDATLDGEESQPPTTRALPAAAPVTDTNPVPVVSAGRGARRAALRRSDRSRRWLVLVPLLCLLLGAVVVGVTVGLPGGNDESADPPASAAAAEGAIVLAADDHVGRPADDVAADLRALGLEVDRRDVVTADRLAGTVVGLDPAGTPLSAGDRVRLDVAVAPDSPSGSGPAVADDPAAPTQTAVTPQRETGASAGEPADGPGPTGTVGSSAPGSSAPPSGSGTTAPPASEEPEDTTPPAGGGTDDGGATSPTEPSTPPPTDEPAAPSDEPAPTTPAEPEQDAGTATEPAPAGTADEGAAG